MKRICIGLLVLLLSFAVMAEESELNISFALGSIDISDVAGGYLPTYIQAGAAVGNLQMVEGRSTQLEILLGGARTSYTLYTDIDGNPLDSLAGLDIDDLKFAFWQADLQMGLYQELVDNTSLYGIWKSEWAQPIENAGGVSSIILDPEADPAAYPDKGGMVSNSLKIGLAYNTVEKGAMMSGISSNVYLLAAPSFLLNEIVGKTDFYQANATVKMYIPIMSIPMDNSDGNSWLNLYFADRVVMDYLTGDAIPQLYQKYPSLGHKMRGFEKTSLGVSFTAVNNLELRATGPVLKIGSMGLGYPRVHLFADLGYCSGEYYNTSVVGEMFTGSAGMEAALDILSFLDVGYRYGFILAGDTISGESSFGELFFFLHW